MNPNRNAAYRMRLAGRSYNEIQATLGISKSTLSGWFKDLILSDSAHARLKKRVRQGTLHAFIKRNKLQTHEARKRAAHIRHAAQLQVPRCTREHLLMIGTALYWAEGYKRPVVRDGKERTAHRISFLNSDPEIIRLFTRFLLEILGISHEHMYASMRLYAHINEKEAKRFWMKASALPSSRFKKTTYLVSGASKGRRPRNRLPYGTLEVGVNNTQKFHYLMGLIEGMKEQA